MNQRDVYRKVDFLPGGVIKIFGEKKNDEGGEVKIYRPINLEKRGQRFDETTREKNFRRTDFVVPTQPPFHRPRIDQYFENQPTNTL